MALFLNSYTEVPDSATLGGAPIDAFQARAFAHNDAKFEELLRGLTHSHIGWLRNDGTDGAPTHTTGAPMNAAKIWRANQVTITNNWDLIKGIPLIVMATQWIEIHAVINGKGKSADDAMGNLGGAGGGSTTLVGKDAVLPLAGGKIIQAGPVGAGAAANVPAAVAPLIATFPPNNDIVLRMLQMAPMLGGGGAGGGPGGGNGGGIVILCAPLIKFIGASAKVDVSGANGTTAGSGGGGGGCVVFIAETVENESIDISNGNGNGGGIGSIGRRLKFDLP